MWHSYSKKYYLVSNEYQCDLSGYTHLWAHSLSRTLTYTHSFYLFHMHLHTHTHTHTHAHTHALTQTHTHTHSHTHTHTHSFYAVYRIIPIASRMVYLGGWQHAICDYRSYVGSSGGGIWAFLFPLSKLPELVDTVFIVLRKQKMVFLHWYHHITGNRLVTRSLKLI